MSNRKILLPPGWVQATDPNSGRVYFANPRTKETRWDPPPISPSASASETSRSPSSERSKNLTGNQLYSASSRNQYNQAYDNPSKLVAMARSMLDKAAAFPEQTTNSDLELHSITPGQIADLCRLQQQSTTSGDSQAYTPLNPYRITTTTMAKSTEQARLDVRLHSLREKLAQFGRNPNDAN